MVDNGNLVSGSAASTSLTLIIFVSAVLFMRAARVKLSEGVIVNDEQRPLLGTIVLYLLAAIVVVISVYPFLYTISTSFKTGSALFDTSLLPHEPTVRNYIQLFEGRQPFGRHLLNSVMVSTVTVAFGALDGGDRVVCARPDPVSRQGTLLLLILAVSMFPQVAVLSGMFELMQAIGLYNKADRPRRALHDLHAALHRVGADHLHARLAEGTGRGSDHGWLQPDADHLPGVHAAAVAGAGVDRAARIHRRVERILFALTFRQRRHPAHRAVSISLITGATAYEVPWGSIMAASVIVTVPLVILVLLFQRKIVSGLTAGAVKG